jgi:uncharacterized protein DUF1207
MFFCLFTAVRVSAQDLSGWALRERPYYEALKAEPRAARVQLVVPAWSDAFPFSVEGGRRFAWQITLGKELPIFGFETQQPAPLGFDQGEWGFGLWIPVSFHMIEDFKDESNPIVNTDYRFGFMTKAQLGLAKQRRLGFRFTPFAHESTHLGDEFTIGADRHFPNFERVNVSYEYFEYGVSLDTPVFTVRHGGIQPWKKRGYYNDTLLGATTPTLTPSEANYEPSFGFEFRQRAAATSRVAFVSIETRRKLIYTYHRAPGASEPHEWSWSIEAGRAVQAGTTGVPLREYFLQVYHGVNPNGQLRSQSGYTFVGLGWTFGN